MPIPPLWPIMFRKVDSMSKARKQVVGYLKALMLPAALYLILLLLIPERVGNLNSLGIMLSMSVIPTMIAYGLSFGMVSGLMDFSIGSRVILTSLVGAVCGNFFGVIGLFVGSILTSVILGALLGGTFRILRIPSLVVSLGALMIFEVAGNAFAKWIATVWPEMSTGYYIRLDQSLVFLGTPPWNFLVLIMVVFLYALVYYRTKFSNQARVVGSDELIARNVGIKPMQVKFQTYLVGAIFIGIAGALTVAYSGAASPQTNMSTMSAVFRPMMSVILAMTLQKLVPVPVGIFIGSFSMNILFTGIIALGWSDDLQNVFLGVLLVIVVAIPKFSNDLHNFQRRRAAKKEFEMRRDIGVAL